MSVSLLLQNLAVPLVFFSTYVLAFRTLSSSLGLAARTMLSFVLATPLLGLQTDVLTVSELFSRMAKLGLVAIVAVAPSVLMVETFRLLGRLCDTSRGAQYAEQITPELGERVSLLESFGKYLALYLFLEAGVHHLAFLFAYQGFFFLGSGQFPVFAVLRMSAEALERGLLLAAPVLIIGFLNDLSVMYLSRGLQKVNVFFEGLPLRLLSGLAVFWFILMYRLDTGEMELFHLEFLQLLDSQG